MLQRSKLDEYTPRCQDSRCEVRANCALWLGRDDPEARVHAKTLRKNWESFKIPCVVSQEILGVSADES